MTWKPAEVPFYFDEKPALQLLAWVRDQGPEEWHGVVSSMNWGTGLEHVVDWICSQPNCHKATALWAFWIGGGPDDWLSPPDPAKSLRAWIELPMHYNLAMNILGYWRRGTYPDHIALSEWQRQDIMARKAIYERCAAKLPATMAAPFVLPEDFDSRGAEIEVDLHYFMEGEPAPLASQTYPWAQNSGFSEVVRMAPTLTYREFQRLHTIELENAALKKKR